MAKDPTLQTPVSNPPPASIAREDGRECPGAVPAGEPNPVHWAVRSMYEEFARELPPGTAQTKRYHSVDGDRFSRLAPIAVGGRLAEIPDGTYRVAGTDWLMTFRQNRLVSALMATAENKYGGRAVQEVP